MYKLMIVCLLLSVQGIQPSFSQDESAYAVLVVDNPLLGQVVDSLEANIVYKADGKTTVSDGVEKEDAWIFKSMRFSKRTIEIQRIKRGFRVKCLGNCDDYKLISSMKKSNGIKMFLSARDWKHHDKLYFLPPDYHPISNVLGEVDKIVPVGVAKGKYRILRFTIYSWSE